MTSLYFSRCILAIGIFLPSEHFGHQDIFAIGISSCDSHRPSPLSAHWQLLRRLITDLPLVTRSARARPAYQPRHNRPTGLYTQISPAYHQPLDTRANWPTYGLVIGHYLCVLAVCAMSQFARLHVSCDTEELILRLEFQINQSIVPFRNRFCSLHLQSVRGWSMFRSF